MTMPSEQLAAGGDGGPAGRFLQLGKLEGRLVCSPDLDQLLSCASDSTVHPICGQPAEMASCPLQSAYSLHAMQHLGSLA